MLAVLLMSSTAQAHVVVQPAEVTTASRQVFTMSVPNEKDIPTTSIELKIPAGVTQVTPTTVAGWQITVTEDDNIVTAITWSGGEIGEGLRSEFTFSARTPEATGDLQWKAYQTYSDGSVMAWDADVDAHSHGDASAASGPFSVTSVTETSTDAAALAAAEQAIVDAKTTANRALYAAIASGIIAVTALIFATRKKS